MTYPYSPDVLRLNPPPAGGNCSIISNSSTGRKGNKYGVAARLDRTYNGRVYASKKEMLKAQELDLMVKAGKLDFYLEQVPFRLPGNFVHRLDFVTFTRVANLPLWEVHYVEVKGRDLALGRLKRKQVEAIFGIQVELV